MSNNNETRKQAISSGLNALFNGNNSTDTKQREKVAEVVDYLAGVNQNEAAEESAEEATPLEEKDLIASVQDEELKELLRQKRMEKRGRPRKSDVWRTYERDFYTRTTLIVDKTHLAKLHEICHRETLTLKEVIAAIIDEAIDVYEAKHGEIVLKDRKGDVTTLFHK